MKSWDFFVFVGNNKNLRNHFSWWWCWVDRSSINYKLTLIYYEFKRSILTIFGKNLIPWIIFCNLFLHLSKKVWFRMNAHEKWYISLNLLWQNSLKLITLFVLCFYFCHCFCFASWLAKLASAGSMAAEAIPPEILSIFHATWVLQQSTSSKKVEKSTRKVEAVAVRNEKYSKSKSAAKSTRRGQIAVLAVEK